jgi:hypothetical protein
MVAINVFERRGFIDERGHILLGQGIDDGNPVKSIHTSGFHYIKLKTVL